MAGFFLKFCDLHYLFRHYLFPLTTNPISERDTHNWKWYFNGIAWKGIMCLRDPKICNWFNIRETSPSAIQLNSGQISVGFSNGLHKKKKKNHFHTLHWCLTTSFLSLDFSILVSLQACTCAWIDRANIHFDASVNSWYDSMAKKGLTMNHFNLTQDSKYSIQHWDKHWG